MAAGFLRKNFQPNRQEEAAARMGVEQDRICFSPTQAVVSLSRLCAAQKKPAALAGQNPDPSGLLHLCAGKKLGGRRFGAGLSPPRPLYAGRLQHSDKLSVFLSGQKPQSWAGGRTSGLSGAA